MFSLVVVQMLSKDLARKGIRVNCLAPGWSLLTLNVHCFSLGLIKTKFSQVRVCPFMRSHSLVLACRRCGSLRAFQRRAKKTFHSDALEKLRCITVVWLRCSVVPTGVRGRCCVFRVQGCKL